MPVYASLILAVFNEVSSSALRSSSSLTGCSDDVKSMSHGWGPPQSSADDGKINQWEFERNSFIELEDNLPRRDPGSLEDVINAYGPWG